MIVRDRRNKKIISNPKEAKMLKKSVSILVIALFVISIFAVAIVSADEQITGTVDSFDAATGELTIKDDAGNVQKLKAGPDVNMESLKSLKMGDQVSVETDSSGAIKSVEAE